MKGFNRRLALSLFLLITGFNLVVLALDWVVPDHWLVIPWWAINFPSFPLFRAVEVYLPPKLWCTVAALGGLGLLSTSLWAVAAGYVLRRREAG